LKLTGFITILLLLALLVQPDLAEQDEVIIQDIVELEKALYEQVCTTRIVLVKLTTFI
jgi:hypothetical protein